MNIGNFKQIESIKVWCQKVLPLVYDDSLSYSETLCKVLYILNKVIENVDVLADSIKTLDVESVVNERLDKMIENGYFEGIIEKLLPDILPSINNRINELEGDINVRFAKIDATISQLEAYIKTVNESAINVGVRVTNVEKQLGDVNSRLLELAVTVGGFENALSVIVGVLQDHEGRIKALEQGGSYELPTATQDRLGGIKVGNGLSITPDGTLSADGSGGGGDMYTVYSETNKTLYLTSERSIK